MIVALTGAGFAQSVTLTVDWQSNTTLAGSCYASCYNPATNHFLVSEAGSVISILNGNDGTDTGTDLDMTGLTVSGLGIFALGASSDGVIFGFNDTDKTIVRWANESAQGAIVATSVAFARVMEVEGTGVNTRIALTGAATNGAIEVYTTSDGTNFTLLETAAAGIAKNGCALNAAGDVAWGAPDVPGLAPMRATKSGSTWTVDAAFAPDALATGTTLMDYDDANNVLVVAVPGTTPDRILGLDGTTGTLLGQADITVSDAPSVNAYGGLTIVGNKVYFIQRGNPNPGAQCGRLSYAVTAVEDWNQY